MCVCARVYTRVFRAQTPGDQWATSYPSIAPRCHACTCRIVRQRCAVWSRMQFYRFAVERAVFWGNWPMGEERRFLINSGIGLANRQIVRVWANRQTCTPLHSIQDSFSLSSFWSLCNGLCSSNRLEPCITFEFLLWLLHPEKEFSKRSHSIENSVRFLTFESTPRTQLICCAAALIHHKNGTYQRRRHVWITRQNFSHHHTWDFPKYCATWGTTFPHLSSHLCLYF